MNSDNYPFRCLTELREYKKGKITDRGLFKKKKMDGLIDILKVDAAVLEVKSPWDHIPGWVSSMSGKVVATIEDYLFTWCVIWDYITARQMSIINMNENEFTEFIKQHWENEGGVKKNYFGLKSFAEYLSANGYELKIPSRGSLNRLFKHTPKLFEIPRERDVMMRIEQLASSGDVSELIAATYGCCAGLLGMRASEIEKTPPSDYRIAYGQDGYVEVYCKRSERKIRFDVLDEKYIQIIKRAWQNAIDNKSKNILAEMHDCEYYHDKYWKNLGPESPHVLRHAHVMWQRHNHGMSYSGIACDVGHKANKTAQKSYDQMAFVTEKTDTGNRVCLWDEKNTNKRLKETVEMLGYTNDELKDESVGDEIRELIGFDIRSYPKKGFEKTLIIASVGEKLVKCFIKEMPLEMRINNLRTRTKKSERH